MSQISNTNSRAELLSSNEEDEQRKQARSKSKHRCRKNVKHHSENCRKKQGRGHSPSKKSPTEAEQSEFSSPDTLSELHKAERKLSSYRQSDLSEPALRSQAFGQDPSPHRIGASHQQPGQDAGGHRAAHRQESLRVPKGATRVGSVAPEKLPHVIKFLSPKNEDPLFAKSSFTSDPSLKDIRKEAVGQNRKLCLVMSVAIVLVGTFSAAGIYFGYSFLANTDDLRERVYRGRFRILNDELLPDKELMFERRELYRKILDAVMVNSFVADQYKYTEVFLLEQEDSDTLVNFNLHFESRRGQRLAALDIKESLELDLMRKDIIPYLDINSLEVQERKATRDMRPALRDQKPKHRHREKTYSPYEINMFTGPQWRECIAMEPGFCSNMPYNITSQPNLLGQYSQRDKDLAIDNVKDIINAECHPLAYELLCQMVHPVCFNGRLVPPCQAFCEELFNSCGSVLEDSVFRQFNCSALPTEADGPGACISKPGCVNSLRDGGMSDRVCDGVVDCPDFSDELYCPYCPEKHFHCGVGKECIPKELICDGNPDCSNLADEKGCLSLSPQLSIGSYIHHYHHNGYLLYQNEGKAGKICAESLKTEEPALAEDMIEKVAEKTCELLEYSNLDWVSVEEDVEQEDIQYVDLVNLIESAEFAPVQCDSKMVIHMECSGLKCGRRLPTLVEQRNANHSIHGDWPWQVSLTREGIHTCDATLIDSLWVMSTASCFQGQSKAKWQAHFGSVRLASRAPWEQTRRIVGMVSSLVEGDSIVLLKLESPVIFSDFARPICLTMDDSWSEEGEQNCLSLGWDTKEDALKPVELVNVDRSQCEEMSEVSVNSLCLEAGEDCNAEVAAGAGLTCQIGELWYLVGVAAWRKSCGEVGQRPRIYDKVSLTAEWVQRVIQQMSHAPMPNRRMAGRRRGRAADQIIYQRFS